MSDKKETLLRNLDTQKSEPFEAEHAKRLLAYPGTRYEAIADSAPAPKAEAAAAKQKLAAAADSPAKPE